VQRSNLNGLTLKGFAVSQYETNAATLVRELKENSQTFLASMMAKPMAELLAAELTKNSLAELISLVPMPSKKSSFQKRGFNPSLLLATKISSQLRKEKNITVQVDNCLKLNREVMDQVSLGGNARRQNLDGAISKSRSPRAQNLWLVDDVVTTGSTLLEAARCLSGSEATVCGFIVFAETLPKNQQKANSAAN
jgi:predicted amidophosphoribosyltransferase